MQFGLFAPILAISVLFGTAVFLRIESLRVYPILPRIPRKI